MRFDGMVVCQEMMNIRWLGQPHVTSFLQERTKFRGMVFSTVKGWGQGIETVCLGKKRLSVIIWKGRSILK